MKTQLKTLTWSDFDQHKPYYSFRKKYGDFSGTILDIVKDRKTLVIDKLWAFTCEGVVDDKTLRLFAVRCARSVQHLMKDQRSINAIDVAERHANGLATAEELELARKEAEEVALATAWKAKWSAEGKTGAEAWSEAWAAAAAAVENAARASVFAAAAAAKDASESYVLGVSQPEWDLERIKQVQIAIELINEFYEV